MFSARICMILCAAFCYGAFTSSFVLAQGSSSVASESEQSLPRIKSNGKGLYYPDKAKRLSAEGRSLLAFNIDGRGRPKQITVESTDGSKLLTDYAVELLKNMVFDSPVAAATSSLENRPYRLSFVFELTPCGRLQHYGVSKDARISMCGSSIPAP